MRTMPTLLLVDDVLRKGHILKKLLPNAEISYSIRKCTARKEDWESVRASDLETIN
jgi:hypothetical protein